MRGTRVALMLATIAVTAAWDTSYPFRTSPVTVLYVGALDCAPCRVWQSGEGRQFRASGEFARVTFREVKSPTLRDVLKDEHWPDDLREYRDRLGPRAAVPLWLVIADDNVLAQGFGEAEWRGTILPRVRLLAR